jgi:hypothetical protein
VHVFHYVVRCRCHGHWGSELRPIPPSDFFLFLLVGVEERRRQALASDESAS